MCENLVHWIFDDKYKELNVLLRQFYSFLEIIAKSGNRRLSQKMMFFPIGFHFLR